MRITGRIKDIIIRGGENIAPKEVEDVLREHPAIADAAVYAVKSEFFGEEVAAAIRVKPGVVFDPVSAQEFFNLLLASAMQGFFADPVYGGNRDKAAWKMIGFPGVIAIYSEHIKTYRNKKYDVEPKSILDLS